MNKEELLLTLGQHIRQLRLAKGLTQKQLAHSLGKDQQSIQRLESGGVNPSYIYLSEIAKGLDMTIKEILG